MGDSLRDSLRDSLQDPPRPSDDEEGGQQGESYSMDNQSSANNEFYSGISLNEDGEGGQHRETNEFLTGVRLDGDGEGGQNGEANNEFISEISLNGDGEGGQQRVANTEFIAGISLNGEPLENEVVAQIAARTWRKIEERDSFVKLDEFRESLKKESHLSLRKAKIYASFNQNRDNSTDMQLSSLSSSQSSLSSLSSLPSSSTFSS